MFTDIKNTAASFGIETSLRRVAVVFCLVGASALTSAASLTYAQQPVFAAVGSISSISMLPQFNPFLGFLSAVTVSFSDAAFTASEVVNLSTKPETVARWSTSTTGATISSGAYSIGDSVTAVSYFGTDATGAAADSGLLAAGASNLGSDSESSTPSYTYTDSATLSDFIGLGNVTIGNSFSADGFTDAYGPQFGFIVNFGSAQASVSYTYTTTTAPGPGAAGTMLFGLFGTILRRHKS